MAGSIVDMHMHTVLGASDSSLRPDDLATEAVRVGLDGVNITEHDRLWDSRMLERFRADKAPLFVNNAMEVSTDMGHILCVGLSTYVPGIRFLSRLREIVDEAGGYLIAAHPFRHFFDPVHFMRQGTQPYDMTPEVLAKLPVFEYVDAIEGLNGFNSARENVMALRVAKYLGKPVSGGSDCHSTQGIGYYCSLFEVSLESPPHLLQELKAGRFHAAHGLLAGSLTRFTETSLLEGASE